jgi:hypothetical protein
MKMEAINISHLADNIKKWDTWVIIIIVAISGILGGLAHKLTSPPEDKTSWPRYLVVGAIASLAVLFVFVPTDPVRLIALSLAAGYGGKSVLDALEARVKTALAEKEAAKAKEDGIKAVEAGKEAVSQAQKLSQIKQELEKDLMKVKGQPREAILKAVTAQLPAAFHPFAAKSPEDINDELKKLSYMLESLEKSFTK